MEQLGIHHPAELGFQLGFGAVVGNDGSIAVDEPTPTAKADRSVVYVAVRDDGVVLKVGQTAATLWRRWRPALVVLDATRPIQIRSNELMDRNRFQEAARGRRFEVWFKQALTTSLRYIPGFQYEASLREAEEVYLDRYYEPILGRLLEGRASMKGAEQPNPR